MAGQLPLKPYGYTPTNQAPTNQPRSIGRLLKSCGLRTTSIKIDPYLNVDAGTMSPFEHGEVFVLDDGGESDLDLVSAIGNRQ